MKIIFLIHILFLLTSTFNKDYIIKPDGTKMEGEVIKIIKNNLEFKDVEGRLFEFKIDKLSVIHISNPEFNVNRVYLTNTNYIQDAGCIHIEMLNNPIRQNDKSTYSNSKSSTTNVNINSENSSSLSIVSDDYAPKSKVILECNDCTNAGNLIMISEDKLSKLKWKYAFKDGSAFPMEMEMDGDKLYYLKFKAGNKSSIEKKVRVKGGVNVINVFE